MGQIIIVLAAGVLVGVLISKFKDRNISYQKISQEEVKKVVGTKKAIIVDVRTPDEYKEEHIKGAILIPTYEIKTGAGAKLPDKDKKIIVYCRTGSRSKSAAKRLAKMGYTDVHDLGGLISWSYGTVR